MIRPPLRLDRGAAPCLRIRPQKVMTGRCEGDGGGATPNLLEQLVFQPPENSPIKFPEEPKNVDAPYCRIRGSIS